MSRFAPLFTLLLILFSCSDPFGEDFPLNGDLRPPVLENVELTDSSTISVTFDEAVNFSPETFGSEPELGLGEWTAEENRLTVRFSENQVPGKMYRFRSDVTDKSGNRLSFLIRFYGWNPDLPGVLINEFNPEGSGNNPDTIELFATSGGNMAGIGLFLGTSRFYSDSFVFPDLQVETGDYIIVHMRPEGTVDEITETDDKAVSGGKLSFDSAWDIWVDGDKPLSGSNGLITLYSNPFGKIMDAVPYSDRVTADSEDYRGWTSTTFDMIEDLSFTEAWRGTEGFVKPEDAVSSSGTTGTRSICRNSLSEDTDSRDDWHIVPTGEKSFGEVNSDDFYIP